MKYSHFKLKLRAVVAVFVMFVFGISANAQQISVSGVVKDAANGEPILGASILQKGTNKGIITNLDGAFTISVPSNATLVVKYLGYLSVEVPVAGKKSIVVQLKENSVALGEVVAIGYGVVKKNDATGSITAIKPDKMNKGLTTNAQDMITGKIAGVNVVSDGGAPGGSSKIRIRGGASLNASNDPLIVVDGLALDNKGIGGSPNGLGGINPNDIESFTVLKDASATAIYGSRASNGVIIITTKKGEKGSKPRVSYDGNMSVSTINKKYDVMNASQFRTFVDTLFKGKPSTLSKLGSADTDWQSLIYQNAISHDHNISVMGGLKNMPYRASFGYTNQDGILKTSNFERYTGSFNLSPSLLDDHLKININAKGMIANNRYVDAGDVVGSAMGFDPTQAVTSTDATYVNNFGGYYQWPFNDNGRVVKYSLAGNNPVATLNQRLDKANSKDFIGNIELDYKLPSMPDLRLHLNLGYETMEGMQTLYVDSLSGSDTHHGRQKWEKKTKYNELLTFYALYAKEIEKHRFDVMAGYEWQEFYDDKFNEEQGLETNISKLLPDGTTHVGGYNFIYYKEINKSRLLSFFSRANYSFDGKYLATVSLRADGSSHFAKDKQWGIFPAGAVAWKINEEGFLKDVNEVTDLKLKIGFGSTGQQDLNGKNDYYTPVYQISETGASLPDGNNGAYTYTRTNRPNPYNPIITWEKTLTYNAGIDYGFFKSRITGSIDYYYRITTDLINEVNAPALMNFNNKVYSNIGSLNNTGIEFSINAKVIEQKDLKWEVGYNITHNENKITDLNIVAGKTAIVAVGGISPGTGSNIQAYAVGQPANVFYVYQQVYDANNKPIEGQFVDRSGPDGVPDGKINEADMYFYKKPTADLTMGLSSKLIFKNFDLSFTLRASLGNYLYNDVAARSAQIGSENVFVKEVFFSNKLVSSLETNFTTNAKNYFFSDYYVQDASFVRCDNISLGYSFKKLNNVISSGRIFATVQNPFVITKYKGLDPEVFDGIDRNIYPRPMISLIGISLNF
ncbi:MAG: TonB-dependent receptor [Paludibacter sp.]